MLAFGLKDEDVGKNLTIFAVFLSFGETEEGSEQEKVQSLLCGCVCVVVEEENTASSSRFQTRRWMSGLVRRFTRLLPVSLSLTSLSQFPVLLLFSSRGKLFFFSGKKKEEMPLLRLLVLNHV